MVGGGTVNINKTGLFKVFFVGVSLLLEAILRLFYSDFSLVVPDGRGCR